ncbi:3-keto-disaccharide hydrolase [Sphingomonas colocasiae]|uniref:DUF1080 domain-containing protein n=1 Tax=Sphingomonas colocasiae TaxID=1848973 RepID=A0ABS7PHI3_9SPHN|nr:DUF1080 domain-containing protein [Sphingomonas colocasiae]MBY8820751.1 DUF1080 domain-containing protein [Sphingomonas colocasiae]
MTGPHRRMILKSAALAVLAIAAAAPLGAQSGGGQAPVPAGFTSLFDGKTLKGWRGDPAYWSVRDGAITGASDQPIPYNTYLILDKPYANFEIRFKYRFMTEAGNSGLQFRSAQLDGNHIMVGMQANVTPITKSPERFAMLYEELGERQEMVLLGQKAEVTRVQAAGGGQGRIVRTVTGMVNSRDEILKAVKPAGQWNEDVLIVHGNRMVHAVNGYLAFDALDKDPMGARDGLLGWQLHKGPASTVQFKDIVIRPLTAFPDISGRFITRPSPAPEPRRTYKDSTKVNLPDTPMPD